MKVVRFLYHSYQRKIFWELGYDIHSRETFAAIKAAEFEVLMRRKHECEFWKVSQKDQQNPEEWKWLLAKRIKSWFKGRKGHKWLLFSWLQVSDSKLISSEWCMHNVSSTKTCLKILQRRHSVYLRTPKALFKSSEGGLHAKFSRQWWGDLEKFENSRLNAIATQQEWD